jgi:hypothetical protein
MNIEIAARPACPLAAELAMPSAPHFPAAGAKSISLFMIRLYPMNMFRVCSAHTEPFGIR